MKKIIGAVITLVIGGTVYTISQADVAKNFAKDTGVTQQEAEQYVKNVTEDDIVPFDEEGSKFVTDGQQIISYTSNIDCVNYSYEWESSTMSCEKGKSQLIMLGNDEIALGNAYIALASESATREDISKAINRIDSLNADFNFEIVKYILKPQEIDDTRKANSYNKALLQSALESKQ